MCCVQFSIKYILSSPLPILVYIAVVSFWGEILTKRQCFLVVQLMTTGGTANTLTEQTIINGFTVDCAFQKMMHGFDCNVYTISRVICCLCTDKLCFSVSAVTHYTTTSFCVFSSDTPQATDCMLSQFHYPLVHLPALCDSGRNQTKWFWSQQRKIWGSEGLIPGKERLNRKSQKE